jgi:hypothetical protein
MVLFSLFDHSSLQNAELFQETWTQLKHNIHTGAITL